MSQCQIFFPVSVSVDNFDYPYYKSDNIVDGPGVPNNAATQEPVDFTSKNSVTYPTATIPVEFQPQRW